MVSTKPPAGMRDFLPLDLRRREYALGKIRKVYETHGFQPIETPVLERIDTLTGKYGQEGDQLVFKVLKRGDKLQVALDQPQPSPQELTDMGMRFDLTVPLCRVVAEYQSELPPIFKCYQIRPVWRADRPAKGRFREFYQCDVDVIGTHSILAEVDVITAAAEALAELGLGDYRLRLNDRRLLTAITGFAGIDPRDSEITLVALDKLDKIGSEGVREELAERGISSDAARRLFELVEAWEQTDVKAQSRLEALVRTLGEHAPQPVVDGLVQIVNLLSDWGLGDRALVFDPALARGLSYYTGPIYELALEGYSGSIGGGGRYDELIGMFLERQVPACGISLGIERILMIMEQRGLFSAVLPSLDVFVTCFPNQMSAVPLRLAAQLRRRGLVVDVYPEPARLKKQLAQAEKMGARIALLAGPDELQEGKVTLKNMVTSQQTVTPVETVVDQVSRWLEQE